MNQLKASDLLSLEQYHKQRAEFRKAVLAHKKQRQAAIGPHVTLHFEDRLTVQYQIQEMLRIERIFESEAIAEELTVYNPLVPDGSNFKATMMIEYPDAEERRLALQELGGIEHTIFVQVAGFDQIIANADEDLERTSDTKTSAVHFLRFELSSAMSAALKGGAGLCLGVSHPKYRHELDAPESLRAALAADLD